MKSQQKNSTERICVECSKSFITKGVRIRCDECHIGFKNEVQKKKDLVQNGIPGWDYIVCPVCEEHFGELTLSHVNKHGFSSLTEFKKVHNLDSIKCGSKCERMRGANNPGYQHGGKLSPFSDKFVAYRDLSQEQIDTKRSSIFQQAKQSVIAGSGYNCSIEYFLKKGLTREDAEIAQRERQSTFSLEKCIKNHGEEEGRAIWEERQRKWQSTLVHKSDEEKTRINKRKSTKINYKTLWGGELDSPGSFYVIRIDDEKTKIGITSKDSIRQRYVGIPEKDVLYFKRQETINVAFMIEQVLKRRYSESIKKNDYGQFGWTEVLNGISGFQIVEEAVYLSERPEELLVLFNETKRR